jgi:hypothetical protein
MTKGQRAMATAILFPDARKGGRGHKNVSKTEGFKSGYISEARTVLKYTPEVAKSVLVGTKRLDEAYEEAKLLKERNDQLPARPQPWA